MTGGLLYVMYHSSQIVGETMKTIGQILGAIMDVILLPLMPIFVAIVEAIVPLIPHIQAMSKAFFEPIVNWIVPKIKWIAGWLERVDWAAVEAWFGRAGTTVVGWLETAWDWIKRIYQFFQGDWWGKIETWWTGTAWPWIVKIWDDHIWPIIAPVWAKIEGFLNNAAGGLGGMLDGIWDALVNFWNETVVKGLQNFYDKNIDGLVSKVKTALSEIWATVWGAISTSSLYTSIAGIATNVSNFMTSGLPTLLLKLENFVQGVQSAWEDDIKGGAPGDLAGVGQRISTFQWTDLIPVVGQIIDVKAGIDMYKPTPKTQREIDVDRQLQNIANTNINLANGYNGLANTILPYGPIKNNVAIRSFAATGADAGGGQNAYDVGFALGTNYVPRTGMYKLHQGEAVIPANENNNSRAIEMQNIFNIDLSTSGSVDDLAREIENKITRSLSTILRRT